MEQMQVRHYLTFEFTGIDDKFVYVVTEDVKNSVQQELLNRSWEISGLVIEFEDTSGRKIAVNAGYICRCQALFDAGVFSAKDADESEPDMTIVIEGMSKPLHYNDIDPRRGTRRFCDGGSRLKCLQLRFIYRRRWRSQFDTC